MGLGNIEKEETRRMIMDGIAEHEARKHVEVLCETATRPSVATPKPATKPRLPKKIE